MIDRRLIWAAAGAAVMVAGVAAVWALLPRETATAATTQEAKVATTRVQRRTLVVRDTLDGQLGFADAAKLTTGRGGTVTRLAREGSVVRRGGVLYAIDGKRAYLFYGSTPAWRPLHRGTSGADVAQLERNLVALGYDPKRRIEVDGKFDVATEAAVKRWEKRRGASADGVVELGEVVFLPGPRRIGEHVANAGAIVQPGAELMETSSTRRVVTVELDADRQGLLDEGDVVDVELPDGRTVRGRVLEVGRVAQTEPGAEGEGEGEPYVEVVVRIPASASGYDRAPVDVHVADETKKNVLAVPIEALLALAGGSYAVEVYENGVRRLVPVELGLFADGYAEISGKGIKEGTRVVVPR